MPDIRALRSKTWQIAKGVVGWSCFALVGLFLLLHVIDILTPPVWHKVVIETGATQITGASVDDCGRGVPETLETRPGTVEGEFVARCEGPTIFMSAAASQYHCGFGYIDHMQGPTEFRFRVVNGKCEYVSQHDRALREAKKPYRLDL